MKVLVAVLLLVIVASGFWVMRSGNDEVATVGNVQTNVSESEVDIAVQPGELSEDGSAVSDASLDGSVVVTPEPTDAQAVIEQSGAASPFATVDDPQDIADPQLMEPTSVQNAESVSSPSETTSANQGALENSQSGSVVVPQSYPVTDAAKYFVPKEERRPGNLGGPPPLNFPGGPSDPNGEALGNTFAPPAAPGN